jgi:phosphotransferase system  glucose/maltose/N-acetylglucosamine-specific IIC component
MIGHFRIKANPYPMVNLYVPIACIIVSGILLGIHLCCFFNLMYPNGSYPEKHHLKEARSVDWSRAFLMLEALLGLAKQQKHRIQ